MATLDFPSSPINGQQYTGPNGAVYTYDGTAWTVTGVISTGTAAGGDLSGTYPNPTVAKASGANLTVTNGVLYLNSGARVLASANLTQESLNEVGVPGQDTAKPVWKWGANATNDNYFVQRAPANTTSFASMSVVDASGNLTVASNFSTGGATSAYTSPGIRVTGTGAGTRYQNVGTALGDGYSNAIGFGWDGTLKARVDTTVIGTVTVSSDARVKQDVRPDVPGLDAVTALRPISFEYDQTKRAIGFERGRQYGLIAQEVAPILPLVVEDDGSDDHWLSIDYRRLVPVLIRAVQELTERVAALEAASANA